jgi:hypothetical protein
MEILLLLLDLLGFGMVIYWSAARTRDGQMTKGLFAWREPGEQPPPEPRGRRPVSPGSGRMSRRA